MTARFEPPRESSKTGGAGGPMVFIVEDDASMRRSLKNLFKQVGLHAVTFGSAREMLQSKLPDVVSCLVLDVRLPGVSGLDFQSELAKLNINIPVVFITGHGDIPMSVKAMKGGAVDFLTKPFRDQELLDAVIAATEQDRKRRAVEQIATHLRSLFDALSPREQAVMKLVAAGLMNKHIAAELGLAEITVKIYRGHVMRKMRARSLAELITTAATLGLSANGTEQT